MSLFSVVGDVHLSVKPPGQRTETYQQDILDKLQFIVDKSLEFKVDGIIFNGDLLHVKTPSRTSFELVQATHEILKAVPCYFTIGNHDIQNNRLDSLPQQPLGALTRMNNMHLMNGPVGGLPVYSIPYMVEDDAAKNLPKVFRKIETWRKKNKYDSVIISSHLTIFPVGQKPPYDYIAADDYANLLVTKGFTYLLANGHIHDIQGESYPLDGYKHIKYVNYGSVSRGSLTSENLKKQPVFYTYDTVTEDLQVFDIPVKPAEQVFKLDSAGAVKERKASMTNFLDSLQSDAVEVTSVSQVVDSARSSGVESSVVNQVEQLLEWVE